MVMVGGELVVARRGCPTRLPRPCVVNTVVLAIGFAPKLMTSVVVGSGARAAR
jgi:hypothetical protein